MLEILEMREIGIKQQDGGVGTKLLNFGIGENQLCGIPQLILMQMLNSTIGFLPPVLLA